MKSGSKIVSRGAGSNARRCGAVFAAAMAAVSSALVQPGRVASAATVTLTATDGAGSSSFNTSGHWSNSAAPTSANAYVVNGDFGMRTPAASGNFTFAGASLNLGSGSNTSYGILTCKAGDSTGDVITINSLTLTDGVLQCGGTPSGAALTWTLAGTGMTVGTGGFSVDNGNQGANRNLIISGNLTGAGPLTKGINQAVSINGGYLALTGNNSGWSGTEQISGGTLMVGTGGTAGSLGTGNITDDGTLAFNLSSAISVSNAISVDTASTGIISNLGTGTVALGGNITATGGLSFPTGTITENGAISGAGILTKSGTGTLTLNGNDSYSGATNVSAGTMVLTGNNIAIAPAANAGSVFALHNSATLQLQANTANIVTTTVDASSGLPTSYALGNLGANDFQISDGNGGSATVQLRSDSSVFFAGTTTGNTTGTTTLNFDVNSVTGATGSTLAIGAIGTYNTTINATGGNNTSFEMAGVSANYGSNLSLNAVSAPFIVGTTGIVGIGTLNISASATTPFTVNGVISPSAAGAGTLLKTGAGTLTLNGNNTFGGVINVQNGNLAVPTVASVGSAQPLGEGSTINLGTATTVGTFEYTGAASASAGQTFNLSTGAGGGIQVDAASATLTHTGTLSGSGPFYKTGPGTLLLSGTYTNTGATNIVRGTLAVGSGTSLSSTTGFNIASGATFDVSADSGFALGSTQTLFGLGTINGPYTHTSGTLAAGNTTTIGTLTVNNGLTLAGGAVAVGVNASNVADLIAVNNSLTIAAPTSITLSFAGTPVAGNSYEIFSYPVGNLTGSLSQLSATNRGVTFTNNATLGEIFANYTGYANLVWTGANGSNWDVQTTQNWYNPAIPGPDYFYQADAVTFDDTNTSGNTNINLTTTLTPTSVLVNSSSNQYSFTGSGSIGGIATLTKNGSSTLTISTANPYSGDTNLGAGSIVVTNSTGAALGTGNLNIASGAMLTVGQGGAGAVGNSTITANGTIVVSSTTLGALGTGTLTIGTTGAVNLSSPSTTGTLANASPITDNGTLIFSGSTYTNFGSFVISGTGTVQVTGTAGVTLGANTYSGGTIITGGGVDPGSNTSFGTGLVTTNGGDIYSSTGTYAYGNNFNFSGFSLEAGGNRVTTINGTTTIVANAGVSADGGSTILFNGPVGSVTGVNPTFTLGGTIDFAQPISLGTGTLAIANSSVVFVNSATTALTVAAVLTGNGTVTQNGPGVAVLTESSSYTGVTAINNGELLVTASNGLGATAGVNTAGGNTTGTAVSAYLALSGGISVPAGTMTFGGRAGTSAASPDVVNVSGNNTLTATLTTAVGGNEYTLESDSGTLTVVGNFTPVTVTGVRYLNFQGAGNGVFNGVISNGTATGGIGLNMNGTGTWTLAQVNTFTGPAVVNSGTLVFGAQNGTSPTLVSLPGGLNIASGATVVLQSPSAAAGPAGRQLLSTPSLITTTSSLLDLGANDLDLSGTVTVGGTAGGASNLSAVTALVAQGYNLTGGANWKGASGITSTAAAASPGLTALGVIQNNQDGTQLYGAGKQFDGTNPGSSDILVKYTYYGDANLDGVVDGSDYSLIDAGYASGGTLTGWLNGDFNYDGVIDGSDYALIDNAYNNQNLTVGASALVATATAEAATVPSAVPEPASVAVIALATAGLIGRRKRN